MIRVIKKLKIPACLVKKKIPTRKQETDYIFQMALSSLGQPQFLCYLRATTTPNMKQQRRVNLDDGTGRYKIVWYPLHKLRSFVRNAIKPECEIDSSVENLLKDVFKQYSYKVLILIERNSSMIIIYFIWLKR